MMQAIGRASADAVTSPLENTTPRDHRGPGGRQQSIDHALNRTSYPRPPTGVPDTGAPAGPSCRENRKSK